jgi:hypothetical protein
VDPRGLHGWLSSVVGVEHRDHDLYFDRSSARQRCHSYCRARVTARIPEDPVQDIAGAVYNCGLFVETRRRCDVSRDGQHALYPVEGSECHLEHRERVESAHLGGLGSLLHVDCVSEGSQTREPACDPRKLP